MGNLEIPHKNYFLTEGLSITDIPIAKKEILNEMISKIEILNYTYICRCCKKIPKIDITYYQDGKIEKLICKNCDYSTELNNKYDFYDDSFCEKIPIENIIEENYENVLKRNKKFFFENLDDFYIYLDVFISYLKVKEQIKKIIYDTKRNTLFSFFEQLLFIGFYGCGTRYEYENSVVIKNFSFDKFKKYNNVEIIKNNKRLLIIKKIPVGNFLIFRLNNDLFMFNSFYPYHSFILDIKIFCDLTFDINKFDKYFSINENEIPLQYRKNFLNICSNTSRCPIVLGENKYLIYDKKESLWIFTYNANKNLYDKYILYQNIKIVGMHLFQKNKISFITDKSVYIYNFDDKKNEISCIRSYLNLYNWVGDFFDFVDSKNGDLMFNLYNKIYHICGSTYEIKNVYKLNSGSSSVSFYKFNEKIIKIKYNFSGERKHIFININKKTEIENDEMMNKKISKSKLNKLFKLGKKYFIDFDGIIDTETSKEIYRNKNFYNRLFIIDQKNSIFGAYNISKDRIEIFEIK